MSEVPEVNREIPRRIPDTFAGLKPMYALERARELLDVQDVNIYLEPYLRYGISAAEIAGVVSVPEDTICKMIDELEVQLATLHLQRYFGHSAKILQLISETELAVGKVAYTDNSDIIVDRR